MTDPVTLALVGVVLAVLGTRLNSFALWGMSIGLLFWSGVMYSL